MPFNIEHIHVFKSCAIVNLSALLHILFHVLPPSHSAESAHMKVFIPSSALCLHRFTHTLPLQIPLLANFPSLPPLFESIHAVEKVLFSPPPPLLPPSSSSSLQPSPGAAALSQLALLGAGLPSMHHSQASEHSQ